MLETSLTKENVFPEALPRSQQKSGIRRARSVWVRRVLAVVLQGTGLLSVAVLGVLVTLFAVPALRNAVAPMVAEAAAPVVAELEGEARAAEPVGLPPASAGLEIGEPVSLATADERVAQYLARRYHIADGAVRVLVAAARSAGMRHHVDPLLILSVMAVESSLNPYAQSAVGATGLMQVMPGAHPAEFSSSRQNARRAALDPIRNVQAGTAILADYIRRGGSVQRGLQLYVGAGNLPDDGGYASHVLAEMARLKLAAQGRIGAALIEAPRTDRGA